MTASACLKETQHNGVTGSKHGEVRFQDFWGETLA